MRTHPEIGVQVPEVLLPNPSIDLRKWAVIACDQYTSQPEYWQRVNDVVGSSPSTLHMILPEVYLGGPEEARRTAAAQQAMRRYLDDNLLVAYPGLVYVERELEGHHGRVTRRGLILALDLERYDFSPGSQSLIRATEGTIIERLPPRMRIREGALLELPHVLVLIDDPERTVIEPLIEARGSLRPLYDTGLMFDSGHLRGYLVDDPALEDNIFQALHRLADPGHFRDKYGVGEDKGVLLFAVGDGNHSLATAKSIWEKLKPTVGMDHPARYALVEVENVHDAGLAFEPIHRVLFGVTHDWQSALQSYFGGQLRIQPAPNAQAVMQSVRRQPSVAQSSGAQAFGVVSAQGAWVVTVDQPPFNLAVGTLQSFLDDWLPRGVADTIDYVHGDDVVAELAAQPGSLGFYLPAMDKSELFRTVILEGSLPRKAFSMGEAREKRFYMESRRITV